MVETTLKIVPTGRFTVYGLPSEAAAASSASVGTTVSNPTPTESNANKPTTTNGAGKTNNKNPSATGGDKKALPAEPPTREWNDELQKDYDRILTVGEECIAPHELKELLLRKGRGAETGFNLYDGFEPSGRMHIAQGVFKAMNVNKCTAPGTNSTFVFWVADWFALMNDKMGGDLQKIKTVGEYLIEVWKAAGMDLTNVVFKWASEEITNNANDYWPTMLDVARRFNITRIKKCCQIMGRLEGSLTAAQILYPLMQCTDIFFLKADICQLGVDQRKVNMLAREYCDAAKIKHKPIILSHHMLYGLKAGQEKMSKSDPDSAVFMEDAASDVERKIANAYCPTTASTTAQQQEATTAAADQQGTDAEQDAGKESMHLAEDDLKNPCLDYIQHIIFSPPNATFAVGETIYKDFASVKENFLNGTISEKELKGGLIFQLNQLLEPVRQHFEYNARAKELLATVRQYKKEAATVAEKTVRRLDLVGLGKVQANAHMVVAPLPNPTPTLQEAVDLLGRLTYGNEDNRPCVLYLPDWAASVCNACQADKKAIAAYYSILVASLKALGMDSQNVQIMYQSEAILADPSNYWISVINVGRHFMLEDVMGPTMKDSEGVGQVIARLMMVADVAGVGPQSLTCTDSDDNTDQVVASLVSKFFEAKLPGVQPPVVHFHKSTNVRLQPTKESEALKTENDEYFLLDDPKVHGKSKMKKAFCEPGNLSFCPPIAIASVFCLDKKDKGSLLISRSEENGGDVDYKTVSQLQDDFVQGRLHPGDLKAATTAVMVSVLEDLAGAIKADATATKASKDLKAFQKKLAKMKK